MFADIQTHLTWLRRFALQHATTRLPFGDTNAVNLAVETGLMSGTSTTLRAEVLLIGAGPDCDVQLCDEGVADEHLQLQLRNSIFGTLAEVSALEPIGFDREEPLLPGAVPRLLRLPLVLVVGTTRLRVSSPAASGVATLFNRQSFALSSLVAVLSVGGYLAVNQIARAAKIKSVALTVEQAPIGQPKPRTDGPAVSKAKLADLGLGEDIIVQTGEGGSLLVQGNVPTARWNEWQAFRSWYDQQLGMPTLVSSVTMAPKLVELRPIASVQLHKPETVFFATGTPAKIGDVIEEGWTLTEIDAEGLTLERSNEVIRIRF
jgi:hypothetical protein